jgi:hypothetical protein
VLFSLNHLLQYKETNWTCSPSWTNVSVTLAKRPVIIFECPSLVNSNNLLYTRAGIA